MMIKKKDLKSILLERTQINLTNCIWKNKGLMGQPIYYIMFLSFSCPVVAHS